MKVLHNHVFVQVESEYNDQVKTKSGQILYKSTDQFHQGDVQEKEAQLHELQKQKNNLYSLYKAGRMSAAAYEKETDFLKEHERDLQQQIDNAGDDHKATMIRRHYGTVVGVPMKLTDEIRVYQDQGAETEYIPSERINLLPKHAQSAGRWASLIGTKSKWKTCADFEIDVQVGDKIYFHHNTITEDNFIGEVDGKKTYKLEYQNAICVVREYPTGVKVTEKCTGQWKASNGDSWSTHEIVGSKIVPPKTEIIPLAGHVLVEPLWAEGVEDLGDGKMGKLSQSGLVTELHEKPELQRGKVAFVGAALKGEMQELVAGDKIVYLPHSDYPVEIEGKTYYVMKTWEIIATF
jgi:co-chaperonin GroES (HSP10)